MKQEHPHMDRVLRVIDYIHENADQDLSLDQLADVAAMSRFHWHRVFSAVMDDSPASVIRSVRMHKASMFLVQTDLPVCDIAKRVGYQNERSFSRAFKESYNLSPAAFRARGQTKNGPSHQQGDQTMYDVTTKTADDMTLAAVRHQGDYTESGVAFQKLGAIMTAGGHWPQSRGMVGVYYDDPSTTKVEDLRSHAGAIWVGEDLPDGTERVTLNGGKFAVLHLKGPYSGLAAAYKYLYGPWLAETQENLRDAPAFEVYLNDPTSTAPADLLTDVYMPLAD